LILLVVLIVALVALVELGPAPFTTQRAPRYSAPLRTALDSLPEESEVREGYDRELFPHWIDGDDDGCDTRDEVLIAESVATPSVTESCELSGARWRSYYDDATWTASSDVDIDHVVALAEAWDSGARTWTASRRERYANDLGDDRALVAVTNNVNRSKGDKDPAEWMPPDNSAHCRYIGEWVVVKIRWQLTVDTTERRALTTAAASCPNDTVTVILAP
jgi:hypothetical protein